MTTAVLRVDGKHLDLDRSMAWIPKAILDASWRQGDPSPIGRTRATAGFTLLLSEGDDNEYVVQQAKEVLEALEAHVAGEIRAGATAEVDFALLVTGEAASHSIKLPGELLSLFSQLGTSVRVTAYPSHE